MTSNSSSSRVSSTKQSVAGIPDVLKPNPHPYAIKSTSTGILSRSSSTSSSAHTHNHYVPVSPSSSPTKRPYTERPRHRYSRSLTDENSPRPLPVLSEDLSYQGTGPSRLRTGSLSESFDDRMNPKLWTYEQLAENMPEIADFVRENEITGRAFLRFDDGVLDAYGITQQWQRSLILNNSLRLRRSMLQNRIWPNSNPFNEPDTRRLSRSDSLSPSKGQRQSLPDEDDPAYLSSSSSLSSASSIGGLKKRRSRTNGRVHGMVASYERSTSPDKAYFRRERSGSTTSLHDDDQYSFRPQSADRPLPLPPQPSGEYTGPLLLPQTSFPNSFPSSLNIPHVTENNDQATPHATGNGNILDYTTPQPTGNLSRPLPPTPLHPSLRPSALDENIDEKPIIAQKNPADEMTMDELITILDPDTQPPQPHAFVNTDRRKAQASDENRNRKGAAAWEIDIGETVKHVVPTLPSNIQPIAGDDELTVEELLALEGGAGAAAWVDEPEGIIRTMKRVGGDGQETKNAHSGSISKASVGKGAEGISLSAGRKSQGHAVRRVGEVFTPDHVVKDGEDEQDEVEALELERMREVERRLLRAEEEERQRWERQATQDARADEEPELGTREDERLRKTEEEKLQELYQREQLLEEETRRLREEAEAKEQRTRELIAAEQQRQEDVEQRLASSIAENRRLLEEFRSRLEQVEQRVEEFEAALVSSATPVQTHGDAGTCVVRRLAAWALSTPLGAALPSALGIPLANLVSSPISSSTNRDEARGATNNHRGNRRTVIALYSKAFPRYALLFSLGVCAFMLRGLARWGIKGVRGFGAAGARGVKG